MTTDSDFHFNQRLAVKIMAYWKARGAPVIAQALYSPSGTTSKGEKHPPYFSVRSDMVDGLPRRDRKLGEAA